MCDDVGTGTARKVVGLRWTQSATEHDARLRTSSSPVGAQKCTSGNDRVMPDAAPRNDLPMPVLARAEDTASNDSLRTCDIETVEFDEPV
jgi:hypothetical protein